MIYRFRLSVHGPGSSGIYLELSPPKTLGQASLSIRVDTSTPTYLYLANGSPSRLIIFSFHHNNYFSSFTTSFTIYYYSHPIIKLIMDRRLQSIGQKNRCLESTGLKNRCLESTGLKNRCLESTGQKNHRRDSTGHLDDDRMDVVSSDSDDAAEDGYATDGTDDLTPEQQQRIEVPKRFEPKGKSFHDFHEEFKPPILERPAYHAQILHLPFHAIDIHAIDGEEHGSLWNDPNIFSNAALLYNLRKRMESLNRGDEVVWTAPDEYMEIPGDGFTVDVANEYLQDDFATRLLRDMETQMGFQPGTFQLNIHSLIGFKSGFSSTQ